MAYPEIGHEKAQSVIDSITNSYAAEGQAGMNPMLNPQQGAGPGFPPPPFGGFPGALCSLPLARSKGTTLANMQISRWCSSTIHARRRSRRIPT